jgi:hypothetical protein
VEVSALSGWCFCLLPRGSRTSGGKEVCALVAWLPLLEKSLCTRHPAVLTLHPLFEEGVLPLMIIHPCHSLEEAKRRLALASTLTQCAHDTSAESGDGSCFPAVLFYEREIERLREPRLILTDEFGMNDFPDGLPLVLLEQLVGQGLIYECTWCPQQPVLRQAYGAHRMFHPVCQTDWSEISQAVALLSASK